MRLFYCLLSFLLVIASFHNYAQERPKIGLVLSGGGAKGAAHIGVLKVLEQYHIPVDYVVGTSIGAYVAGLYALGYSANDIEKIMLELPWDDGYSDFIPREQLSFKNKVLRDKYNLSFRVGLNQGKIQIPSGLILGQSADQLMKTSTDVVATFDDFDQLAIPYRAIAADIVTANTVVISKGSITKAMRASAAVPGIVEPVKIEGKLLVDGGIVNNMPIDVVRNMGADIILAVDIGSPLLDKEDLDTTIDVINQLSNILTNNTSKHQKSLLTEKDILLRPAIGDLSTTDFSIIPEALALGEQSATSALDKLQKLAVSPSLYAEYKTSKKIKSQAWFKQFNQKIVSIQYNNDSKVNQQIIEEKFAIKVGDVVTKETLKKATNRVYALNEFEHVDAEFTDLPEGRVLTLTTEKKSWGPNYLKFGFSLESDFSQKSVLSLDAGYVINNITENGGQWLNEVTLGWEILLASEFYQPLTKSQRFYANARIEFDQDKWEATSIRPELMDESFQGKFGLGYNYADDGTVEIGLIGSKGNLAFEKDGSPTLKYDNLGSYLTFNYDNLNSIYFPTKGHKVSLNFFWRQDHYDNLETVQPDDTSLEMQFDWKGALSFNHHSFVGIASFATVHNDNDFSVHVQELGGFLNLSGLQKDELIGVHKVFAAIVYQYDIGKKLFGNASLPMYLGTSIEAGNIWTIDESVKANDLIKSGSLYLGTDTSFGPAVLGIGFASGGKSNFFISLGKSF